MNSAQYRQIFQKFSTNNTEYDTMWSINKILRSIFFTVFCEESSTAIEKPLKKGRRFDTMRSVRWDILLGITVIVYKGKCVVTKNAVKTRVLRKVVSNWLEPQMAKHRGTSIHYMYSRRQREREKKKNNQKPIRKLNEGKNIHLLFLAKNNFMKFCVRV